MSLSTKLRKDELLTIAEELGIKVPDSVKVIALRELIEKSDVFKNQPEVVQGLVDQVTSDTKEKLAREREKIEREKIENETKLELERLKLNQIEKELELTRARNEYANTSQSSEDLETSSSMVELESLIRSIKTLTISVPCKSESFNLFFNSLEKAFQTKTVPVKLRAEILLNILGEKVNNLLVYVNQEDLEDYDKIKTLVLKEFEPTPQECLNNFKKAQKLNSESYVQFASRLGASFDYYCKLRQVNDFKSLCELIVSDRIFETLDRELMTHIGVKQGETYFKPQQLGRECDIYLSSKGKKNDSVYKNAGGETKRFGGNKSMKSPNLRSDRNVSKVFMSEAKGAKCVLCKNSGNHPLHLCSQFKRLSVWERSDVVKRNNLCFRCFLPHKLRECPSDRNCFCGQPHNRMIHFPREDNGNSGSPADSSRPRVPAQSEVLSVSNGSGEELVTGSQSRIVATSVENGRTKNVLLSTVRALVKNKYSEYVEVRCLLDVGSQSCLCTRACAERLQLRMEKINTVVSCVNDASMVVCNRVRTTVANRDKSFERELSMLVVNKITDLIPNKLIEVCVDVSEIVPLADHSFNKPGRIDMLLGAELFYELLRPGQIYALDSQLLLQNTVFGYVASGSVTEKNETRVHCGLILDDDLNSTLRSFWETESVESELKNSETAICDEHFKKTHFRNSEGRYTVKMPFKEDPACLGQSKGIAEKRLNSLWNRLARNPEHLSLYRDFLSEYESLGHMHEITENKEPEIAYYMPHHGIYRPEKSTTKLRVVFNASTLTSNGNSLNSIQYNGGVIQEDLFSIMLRFRRHRFVFTADIEKMYRMIEIHPDQRKLQRILWKNDINGPIKTYELATVTYGTVSAPYLAMRTLNQLALDESANYPLASPVLLNDFYMDDVLSGSESLKTAKELQCQLIGILRCGGMSLHKWCSNHPELAVNDGHIYPFSKEKETSALGVLWKPTKDCLSFKVKIEPHPDITKRHVLSVIARIFDPLGLLGPVISKAKIFMQRLWQLNLEWSDKLPTKEIEVWNNFSNSLQTVNEIDIDRCILIPEATLIELHGFCDSSESAFGAVVYCKSRTESGEVMVRLITSKSRVAPIKKLTIPRLELCAAVLLAKLMTRVHAALKINVNNIFYWTDSMIVLSWLQKESYQLKTFVANRVVKIQDLTSVQQWGHVPSKLNPADLISRGVDPDKLMQSELWWMGPPFLMYDLPSVSQPPVLVQDEEYRAELKSVTSNLMTVNKDSNFFESLVNRTNDFLKLIHILVYIFRFINNSRKNASKRVGSITVEEFNVARETLVRSAQVRHFSHEMSQLKKGSTVAPNSKLRYLNPFIDDSGLIRVGGRLGNSDLEYNHKFPIVLPSGDKLTKLIFVYYHRRELHVGPQGLLNAIRQNFWPIGGRNLARKTVHECFQCFKANPTSLNQIMGNLPPERVLPSSPFSNVGIDFCGPFYIQYKHQRKGTLQKVYVCIFVCMATKAVHLEIVSDLTTEALIATLKRFFSRRGRSCVILSDNATNFTGASSELKRFLKSVSNSDQNLANFLTSEGIVWKFLPPRSPNFGGLWEAGVKSYKYHLKRVIGDAKLTLEEFLTVTTQIEGILNSRPLCPLSPDSEKFDVLTPGHFLIGRPITALVEPNFCDRAENLCSRWQRVQRMVQTIWRRWQNSYLSHLQNRHKWQFAKDNVLPDTLVLLKDSQLPVCKWSIGRILKTFPGSDGKVRVVLVKTQNGVFKRAISNICVLPVSRD